MEFSRQEYWSGLPFPSPGDLPNPGIEPRSPTLQADSLSSEPPGKSLERGLINAKKNQQTSPIKCGTEIVHLIEVFLKPKEVAVIHCHGHQKGISQVIQRDDRADQKAKKAAQMARNEMALIPSLTPTNLLLPGTQLPNRTGHEIEGE